jgi:hypothetical protein
MANNQENDISQKLINVNESNESKDNHDYNNAMIDSTFSTDNKNVSINKNKDIEEKFKRIVSAISTAIKPDQKITNLTMKRRKISPFEMLLTRINSIFLLIFVPLFMMICKLNYSILLYFDSYINLIKLLY